MNSYSLNSVTRDSSEEAVMVIEERLLACYGKDDYFNITSQKKKMEMMLSMKVRNKSVDI